MNAIFSAVANWAAMHRSPSFSRSGSSQTTTIPPRSKLTRARARASRGCRERRSPAQDYTRTASRDPFLPDAMSRRGHHRCAAPPTHAEIDRSRCSRSSWCWRRGCRAAPPSGSAEQAAPPYPTDPLAYVDVNLDQGSERLEEPPRRSVAALPRRANWRWPGWSTDAVEHRRLRRPMSGRRPWIGRQAAIRGDRRSTSATRAAGRRRRLRGRSATRAGPGGGARPAARPQAGSDGGFTLYRSATARRVRRRRQRRTAAHPTTGRRCTARSRCCPAGASSRPMTRSSSSDGRAPRGKPGTRATPTFTRWRGRLVAGLGGRRWKRRRRPRWAEGGLKAALAQRADVSPGRWAADARGFRAPR